MARGGVLLRVGDGLLFVTASDAVRLAPLPPVTRIPGAPEALLGVALHEGEIFPVLSIGQDRMSMLVCSHRGSLLGLAGGVVVMTGMFDETPDGAGVIHEGEVVRPLDVGALFAEALPPAWAGRWLG